MIVDGFEVEIADRIATVTIARPDGYNAVSLAMWQALPDLFGALDRDRGVTGVVLTGAGRMFSAGADIADFEQTRSTPEQVVAYEAAVDLGCDAIAATGKPVVAAIRSYCLGGACNLAMACDFRFVAPDAQMAIPAARLSIVYSVKGMSRLLALVGLTEAKRILYTAERFGAEHALKAGFADRIEDDPAAAAIAWLGGLAGNAPLSIAGSKLILNSLSQQDEPFAADAAAEAAWCAASSKDYAEGRAAFAQKRPPLFEGL